MCNKDNDLSAWEEANVLIACARYSQVTLDALARVPFSKFREVSLEARVPYWHLLRLSVGLCDQRATSSLPKLYDFFFPDKRIFDVEQSIARGWRYGCKL